MATKPYEIPLEMLSESINWQEPPSPVLRSAVKKTLHEQVFGADNVNHPSHYTYGKIEVIDYIEDKRLNYHLGNVIKYISRAGKKGKNKEIEDLKKARWYLDRYIERLENANEETL